MSLRGFQYSVGKITTDIRTYLARNNPLEKQENKAIAMWVFHERNDLATMKTLQYQQTKTIEAFRDWTKEIVIDEKKENSRDLEDIGSKLARLLEKQVEIETDFANKHQRYRQVIKAIQKREESILETREKKRALMARIDNLTKTSPKSPKLQEFQRELDKLEHEGIHAELELGDFKRFAIKEAFYLRFNAMVEMSEKMSIVAGFGKYIVDLLDIEPTPADQMYRRPYEKGPEAAMILADALQAIDNWSPIECDERPTLAATAPMSDNMSLSGTEIDDDMAILSVEASTTADEKPHPVETDLAPTTPLESEESPLSAPVDKKDEDTAIIAESSQRYEFHSPNTPNETTLQTHDLPASTASPSPSPQIPLAPYLRPQSLPTHDKVQSEDDTKNESDGKVVPPGYADMTPVFSSPQPMYNYSPHQMPFQPPQPSVSLSQTAVGSGPMSPVPNAAYPVFYKTSYDQLYQHMAHHHQRAPNRRPYEEFQRQYMFQPNQRVDAGGFRIPQPAPPKTEALHRNVSKYAVEDYDKHKPEPPHSNEVGDLLPVEDNSSLQKPATHGSQ